MDYKKHYDSLMEKAKSRQLTHVYKESHHIVPKCMGGCDSKTNLVYLTYREHYLAHWMLHKMYPENYKLLAALIAMSGNIKGRIIPSWVFEKTKKLAKDVGYPWLREYAKENGSWNKGTKGVSVAWNKGKKLHSHSNEHKQKVSSTLKLHWKKHGHNRKGISPWNKGLVGVMTAWNKGMSAKKFSCYNCGKLINAGNLNRWHNENCGNKK